MDSCRCWSATGGYAPYGTSIYCKSSLRSYHNRQLLDQLQNDVRLRCICGWEKARDVPEEWTFSRAFVEFLVAELPTKIHEALIFRHQIIFGHEVSKV